MSKFVLRGHTGATPFEASMIPLSELPPPEQRKGNRIAEVVRQQKEEIRKSAYDEGYRLGLQSGHTDGFQAGKDEADRKYEVEIARFVGHLQAAEQRIDEEFDRFLAEAEEQLSSLAVIIAERLLRTELHQTREAVVAIAKDAIKEVRHGTSVRIRVNPFDGTVVDARAGELLAASSGLRKLDVVRDPSIQGGCVIESDGGVVDARIEMALDRIVAATRGTRSES